MTDIDHRIRLELTRRADLAPPPPGAEQLLARANAVERHHTGRALLYGAVGVATVVAGMAVVVVDRGGRVDTSAGAASLAHVDLDGDGRAEAALGPPVALAFPATAEAARPFAVTGTTLVTASTSRLDGPVEVTTLSLDGRAPVEAVTDGPAGMATALAAADDRVVVVVSRHGQELPPVMLVSEDGGRRWAEQVLPWPDGVAAPDAFATGVAVTPDRIVVVGGRGVWTSTGDGSWDWTSVADRDDQLHDVVWDGTSFLISGRRPDLAVTAPGGDSDPAFWRSADGTTWTGPEVVRADADLRTSDGAGPIVAGPGGVSLSVAPAQSWSRDMEAAGTVAAASIDGQPFVARFVPGWYFQTALATDWGFITAAHDLGDPDVYRFLGSVDGQEWTDLGPAPGGMLSGATWGDGLVVNGYGTDDGSIGTWFLPPLDETGITLSPAMTLPPGPDRASDPSRGRPDDHATSTVPGNAEPGGSSSYPASDTTIPG